MRFELQINGEHVCYAGLQQSGTVAISIHGYHIDASDPEPLRTAMANGSSNDAAHIHVHGSYGYGKGMRDIRHMQWSVPNAKIGDEITIRLLPNGEASAPVSDGPIDDLHFSPLLSLGTLRKLYRFLFSHGVSFSLGKAQSVKKEDE